MFQGSLYICDFFFLSSLIFENALETQQWKETLKNATEIGLCTQHGFSEVSIHVENKI